MLGSPQGIPAWAHVPVFFSEHCRKVVRLKSYCCRFYVYGTMLGKTRGEINRRRSEVKVKQPRGRKMKHKLLIQLAAALCATLIALAAQAADKKPNIIVIVSDDFGYGDSGA